MRKSLSAISITLECVVVLNFESRVLIFFLQDTITYDENLNVNSP